MTHDELVAFRNSAALTAEDTAIWMVLMSRRAEGSRWPSDAAKVATAAYPSITHVSAAFTKWNDEQTMTRIERLKAQHRADVLNIHLRGNR